MLRAITPATINPPLANYSHAVEVAPNARWLYLAGQVGIAPDGTVPPSCAEQAEACFANIMAILAEAGMGAGDLVRLNTYLIDPADRAARLHPRHRARARAARVQDRDRSDRGQSELSWWAGWWSSGRTCAY